MGASNIGSRSMISNKFVESLTIATPLKSINQAETEVHEIHCLSAEHHQIMLEKIRIKKGYDCPFIIRIVDSHTFESKNLCSTITKTYIVVQKPQSLAEEIEQRALLTLGFEEAQIWTLIYSCTMGALYLRTNNVELTRLNSNQIFIDIMGRIKMNDPDFSEGSFSLERIKESEFIKNLSELCKELMTYSHLNYSQKLLELISLMEKEKIKFWEIETYIKKNYVGKKTENFRPDEFSCVNKSRQIERERERKKLRILSGKKSGNNHLENRKETSYFTSKEKVDPHKRKDDNKQNNEENHIHSRKNRLDLYAQKSPENLAVNSLFLDSHKFPRKALLQQKMRTRKANEASLESVTSLSSTTHKQLHTRGSHSVFVETDPSLDGSQLLNMISSYQVDQETFVREVCQQQSQYFLQLMNQMKCKAEGKSGLG